jgi:hypothetical protein
MKRRGFTFALTFGVLLACSAAEAQLDQVWKKVDTTLQSNNPPTMALSNDEIAVGPSDPLRFIPVTPCRVADTRRGNPIQGGTHQDFTISGPTCGIPASAAAYSLNVSVAPRGSLRYITVWPTGQPQPVVTTLNSLDGRIKSNAAIVAAGTGDAISVYASDTTDVLLDINGYFAPDSGSTLAFYPLSPCRVADTRNPPGPLGGPYLQGGQERDFPVLLASSCHIPSSAQAYSMNFAVLPRTGFLGFLTVWPAGQPRPLVSTLVDPTGTIVANAAIVPAGTGGDIAAYATNDTDLVIDINGYFAAPGSGGLSLYTISPCRALDTRKNALGFSGQLRIPVLGVPGNPCALSGTAQALVFNATVFPRGPLNYLTLWPDGEPQPLTWTLNAVDGAVASNMAIVSTTNGSIDAYASGITQLILDISSYFAP